MNPVVHFEMSYEDRERLKEVLRIGVRMADAETV